MIAAILWTLFGILVFLLIAIKCSWLKGVSSFGNVRCSPQYCLRGSRNAVTRAAVEHIQKNNPDACADPKVIEEVIDLIEAYTSIKYSKVEDELCNGYEAYDPMVHHRRAKTLELTPSSSSSSSSSLTAEGENSTNSLSSEKKEKEKEEKPTMDENTFLEKVTDLLEKANFRPLTKKELDFATKEEYLLTVPVQVSWANLDTEMITSYYKQSGKKANFENGDKIMIFHRGVTLDVTKGRLIWEKIDVFTTYILGCLVKAFRPLINKILGTGSAAGTSSDAAAAGSDGTNTLDMTEPYDDKSKYKYH